MRFIFFIYLVASSIWLVHGKVIPLKRAGNTTSYTYLVQNEYTDAHCTPANLITTLATAANVCFAEAGGISTYFSCDNVTGAAYTCNDSACSQNCVRQLLGSTSGFCQPGSYGANSGATLLCVTTVPVPTNGSLVSNLYEGQPCGTSNLISSRQSTTVCSPPYEGQGTSYATQICSSSKQNTTFTTYSCTDSSCQNCQPTAYNTPSQCSSFNADLNIYSETLCQGAVYVGPPPPTPSPPSHSWINSNWPWILAIGIVVVVVIFLGLIGFVVYRTVRQGD